MPKRGTLIFSQGRSQVCIVYDHLPGRMIGLRIRIFIAIILSLGWANEVSWCLRILCNICLNINFLLTRTRKILNICLIPNDPCFGNHILIGRLRSVQLVPLGNFFPELLLKRKMHPEGKNTQIRSCCKFRLVC